MAMYDVPREAWEQEGYRIAEHTTAPPVSRHRLEQVVIHYPGTDKPNPTDPRRKIAASQRYYATNPNRGYSYGYNFIIGPMGMCYQVRGLEYRSAATAGANSTTVAIQIMQPVGYPANELQVKRVQQLVADLREWAGKPLPLVGHKEAGTTATACPGAEIFAQMKAGVFEPADTVDGLVDTLTTSDLSEEVEMNITVPSRVFDSRQSRALNDREAVIINTGMAGKSAVFVNLTTTQQKGVGFLTAWSGETDMPTVSNLNYTGGVDLCNTSWVPLAADGTFKVYANTATHLIVDVQAVA